MAGFLKKFLRRIYLLLVYLVVYKKKCNSLQLQIFNYISSWYYISWSRPPPAKWFSLFCSWECKSAPSSERHILLSQIEWNGASSSRTKRMHWNSLKILNNLFESEIKFWDLPSIHEVPKFSTCILQLHTNSTVPFITKTSIKTELLKLWSCSYSL